jgi:hypothetical protein
MMQLLTVIILSTPLNSPPAKPNGQPEVVVQAHPLSIASTKRKRSTADNASSAPKTEFVITATKDANGKVVTHCEQDDMIPDGELNPTLKSKEQY